MKRLDDQQQLMTKKQMEANLKVLFLLICLTKLWITFLCPSPAIFQILHTPAVRDHGRGGEPVRNRAATVSHRIDPL